jgi:hypothetical protein
MCMPPSNTILDHQFEAYGNPDVKAGCVRCPYPEGEHPPAPPERNLEVEAKFIKDALTLAERSGWPLSGVWERQVRVRLEMGQREYGNRALTQDNLPDICEETPDLGSWPVLELQRLILEDAETYDDDRMDLLAIAAHGAAADYYARRIMRRRSGLE